MMLTRYNHHGSKYYIMNHCAKKTIIIRAGNGISIVVDMPLEEISQCWYYWQTGCDIDEVFSTFTPDQREFLITGIKPE